MIPNPGQIMHAFTTTASDINEHLQFIHDEIAGRHKPTVIELGVWEGRSTSVILCALTKCDGRLTSVDIKDYPRTVWRVRDNEGLGDRWTFKITDSLAFGEKWTQPIDVLLIDSSHQRAQTEAELRLYAPKMAAGGTILLHDTTAPEWAANVMGAIDAFRADHPDWQWEHRAECNGLGILRKPMSGSICRFPFTHPRGLTSTSGPDVLVASLTEALRAHPRFQDLNTYPSVAEVPAADVLWFPVGSAALRDAMKAGRRIAIGPNVLFGNSQAPGACAGEQELMAYENFAAVFTLSRWYAELTRQTFRAGTPVHLLDFPLPESWRTLSHVGLIEHDAMIYIKGGAAEEAVARRLQELFPSHRLIRYGAFARADLLEAARTSRACFYVSREDHYPLAAVEIGLMGCPIISDEKSCPVLMHAVTGVQVPVRERGCRAPFVWATDAADRMAAAWGGALTFFREDIRDAVLARHDPLIVVARISSILQLETEGR